MLFRSTYTWRAVLVAGGLPYEVLIGGSASLSLENLELAFQAQDGEEGIAFGIGTAPHPTVSGVHTGVTFLLTAKVAGAAGNLIGTTTTMLNATFGNITLTGGVCPRGCASRSR